MHAFNAIKRSSKMSYCTFIHYTDNVSLSHTLFQVIFHLSSKNLRFGIQGSQQHDFIHILSQKCKNYYLISHIDIMM